MLQIKRRTYDAAIEFVIVVIAFFWVEKAEKADDLHFLQPCLCSEQVKVNKLWVYKSAMVNT